MNIKALSTALIIIAIIVTSVWFIMPAWQAGQWLVVAALGIVIVAGSATLLYGLATIIAFWALLKFFSSRK